MSSISRRPFLAPVPKTVKRVRDRADLPPRFLLLAPSHKYQEAVDLFSPYGLVPEPNTEARAAGAKLIQESLITGCDGKTFTCVSNRLEGNALLTIAVMRGQAGAMT